MVEQGKNLFMAMTNERRLELEEDVTNFCKEFELNFKEDVVQELGKIGFQVVKANFSRQMDGMLLVDETKQFIPRFSKNKVIAVNSEAPLYFARFIILHELAHYIEERKKSEGRKIYICKRDHSVGNYSDNDEEQEKDYMAAAMLIPREELKYYIEKYAEGNSCEKDSLLDDKNFIRSIQDIFKVQNILVERRIEEVLETA